jgi:hypothetical protein
MHAHWMALVVALVAIILSPAEAPAQTHYLAPDGDDAAAGTEQAPWRSLQRASEALAPGTTLVLMPGEYPGTLAISAQASADAPVVVRAAERRTARLTSDGDGGFAVSINGAAHVRLEGLWLRPDPVNGRWLLAADTSHLSIEDCLMEKAGAGLPLQIEGCKQLRIIDSVIREHYGGNMARIAESTRVLIEGCSITRTGHCPLQLFPDGSNSYVVLRGNVFHSGWGRNFALREVEHILFEHNVVTNAFNSGRSASSYAKFWPTPGIFRFNRVFHNHGGALNAEQCRNARYYNNVFDHNAHDGHKVSGAEGRVENVVFANNVFSRNDQYGSHRQLQLGGGTAEQVRLIHNVFHAPHEGLPLVQDYGARFTLEALAAEHGERYRGNLEVEPGFADPALYDHALRDDSPLRDAGAPLTHAVGAGEGTRLAVTDPWGFYDGYGIEGEQGDLIAVGDPGRTARVVEVDHQAGALVLDRVLSWSDGDPVSLPWSGEAPDIGAFEHGADGRASVQVVAEPFEARPGERVTLRAIVHGNAAPREVRWQLGDGTLAVGFEVTHSYAEEYDYPIRVRVVDEDGRVHRGAGYVVVAETVDPSQPLVHTTWDRDDDSAWWLWKSYRPFPARYQDRVDAETGRGHRHVVAPEDRGWLPAQIHPIGWDIDRYPRVLIRYRVGEGTPISIELRAFSGPSLIAAASPAASVSEDRWLTGDLLRDDEQWHELAIDARVIREINPEVQVLEGLRIGAAPRENVKEGHWYELDEVIIGP